MKISYIYILLLLISGLHASDYSGSVQMQYEIKDFKNSRQKTDGVSKFIAIKQNIDAHQLKLAYERTDTNTMAHIPENLKVKKLYARYSYEMNKKLKLYGGYIYIDDNLVSTDGGKIYSMGMSYAPKKALSLEFTGYYGDYEIMKTYQIDAKLVYKNKLKNIKSKTEFIAKNIHIDDCKVGEICTKAQNSYLTPGIKQTFKYDGYFLKAGAYFSKRAFAVMHEGFRVQHHAMEFDKTFLTAIGKKFNNMTFSLAYIYQEAEELPSETKNVEVRNTVFSFMYSF